MPTIGGLCNLLGVFGPLGPKVGGVVCQFMFTLVLYISCQQLGVMCNSLGVFGPGGYTYEISFYTGCDHCLVWSMSGVVNVWCNQLYRLTKKIRLRALQNVSCIIMLRLKNHELIPTIRQQTHTPHRPYFLPLPPLCKWVKPMCTHLLHLAQKSSLAYCLRHKKLSWTKNNRYLYYYHYNCDYDYDYT